MEQRTFETGRYLFREHEYGDFAFSIESGEVEIIKNDGDKVNVVAVLGPGKIIGELALICDKPRTSSARARSQIVATAFSRKDYELKMMNTDPFIRALIRILSEDVVKMAHG